MSALSAPYSFTVDTSTTESAIADRAVTTGTDGQSYINAANFNGDATTLTGMAEAGDTVSVMINGGAGQAATVAADGSWSLTLTGLADSESVSAVATATDPAGNTATSVPFAFTVDTTPPALPTVSNLADFLNASYDVGFTVTAGAAVTVDVNGSLLSPAQLSADFARTTGFVVDNYTAQPDDFVGTETIVVSATLTDAAGNISAPGTLTLKPMDTTPPATPTVTLPLSYVGTGATGHWKIGGAAEAGSTVTVSDGSTNWSTVATGGAWSVATTDNNAAIRDFTVTAADAVGNTNLPSAAYFEGMPGADIFNFATEVALSAAALINGGLGNDTIQMTSLLPTTVTDADLAHAASIEILGLTGASTVTLGTNASLAGISTVNVGNGTTSITDSNAATLTVNAAALGAGNLLSLAGSTANTVTNLTGNLAATGKTGALTVTATGGTALNIATGSAATSITDSALGGSVMVDATALGAANTLTLKGSATETVIDLVGNVAATTLTGALDVTATGSGTQAVTAGAGGATITDNKTAGALTVTTGVGNTSIADNATGGTLTINAAAANALTVTGAGVMTVKTGSGSITINNNETTGLLTVNATALAAASTLTLTGGSSGTATVTGFKGTLNATGDSGAVNVTATGAGAQVVTTGSGNMSIADSTAGGSIAVDATTLGTGTLTLTGSAPETVNNFSNGTINATGLTAASTLNITATGSGIITTGTAATTIADSAAGALTVNAGSGALTLTGAAGSTTVNTGAGNTSIVDNATGVLTVNANATAAGPTLTLSGWGAERVTNLAENIVIGSGGLTGALDVTATGSGTQAVTAGAGGATITQQDGRRADRDDRRRQYIDCRQRDGRHADDQRRGSERADGDGRRRNDRQDWLGLHYD